MIRISVFIFLLFSTVPVMVFFLPLYLGHKGLDTGQIGLVMAAGAGMALFGQPFWGFMSDKRKTVRKIILLVLIASFIISMGLFSAQTFLMILLAFIAFNFFNSAMASLTEAFTLSHARQSNSDYGRVRMWGEVGVGASSFVLGILIDSLGIQYLWVIYLVLISLAICALMFTKDTKATPEPVDLSGLVTLFKQPRLLWFLFMVLLVAIPHRMNDSMFAVYLEMLGGSSSQLGLAWAIATASTVPTMLFVGRMINRWNELGIFIVASLVYAGRWLVYSFVDSPNLLMAAQAFHSFTFPLFFVASIQYIAIIVPNHLRATGIAAYSVVFAGIGGIIGNAAGGYLMNEFGGFAAYASGGGLALIGAVAAIITYMVYRNKGTLREEVEVK